MFKSAILPFGIPSISRKGLKSFQYIPIYTLSGCHSTSFSHPLWVDAATLHLTRQDCVQKMDQIDMTAVSQSRFRILMHEPKKRKDDSSLSQIFGQWVIGLGQMDVLHRHIKLICRLSKDIRGVFDMNCQKDRVVFAVCVDYHMPHSYARIKSFT